MRIPAKSLGSLLLASGVALTGFAQQAHARSAASPVTVTIDFQQFGPPPYYEQIWLNRVKSQFEKSHPNIKIKLNPIIASEGDYYTKIDLALRSGSGPDIIREDSFLVSSDVTAGYLEPLDSYLAKWPEYKTQWFPSMQRITQFNGHNYGVMNGTDVRLIWYNKDLFKKAGLPTSWQPHNWNDILSAAQTIKKKLPGVIPINMYTGINMDEASTMQTYEMLLYGTPDKAPLYDYKTKKWVVSSKGILDTLSFLQKIYNSSNRLGPNDDIALSNDAGTPVTHNLLPGGKLAIDVDGSWISSTWYANGGHPWKNWQNVMGVAKMPTEFGQGAHYVTLSGGWAYSINAKSKHKNEAFEFIKAAYSRDNLAFYDVNAGQVTPRKDVVDVPAYRNVPLNTFFTSLLNFTQFRPGFPAYPKISVEIDRAMQSVMQGTSPQDAMNTFKQRVTGIVGANNVETLK